MAEKKIFYPGYHFIYPNINQSLKSWFDYVFLVKHKPVTKKKKKMEDLLDHFYERLEASLKQKFNQYIAKVSQVKGSFYVLIRKLRGKILNNDLKFLFENLKHISVTIYNRFAEDSSLLRYNFFPYFKLSVIALAIIIF